MPALAEVNPLHWVGFITIILVFLALDLGVFHRQAHVVSFREALLWTLVWFTLSMLFAGALFRGFGREDALQFVTGYLIELSLSMDNVFVIALIFAWFRVPLRYQHRVLFWGILGALVMRGGMIALGAALIARFHWALYVFGVFLVITGIKMLFSGDEGVHPEKNVVLKLVRMLFPVSPEFEGQRFTARWAGRFALTPLALVLLMVETTDLVFAVDSIPAIFAVTQKPFIVFTSNIFAILGLRSLYFVLANAIDFFRHLKTGLAIVLTFIGCKMLIAHWDIIIPTGVSLAIVAGIIAISILLSLFSARVKDGASPTPGGPQA